ncbi:hypothetical protein [Bailinhaonella thermotolerans]|uniref:Uncharacterized protein n=1 Tax=Bailinhaonella thermotolerans TaxID=1070861 RepID=A0A3A4B9R2_9ACTN|nr:hypothetical protein [Bailinhaonella thermotolerans]RJL34464.1 hypothetical protein D5H75_08560 [Bailinhaonella thermotolerans]
MPRRRGLGDELLRDLLGVLLPKEGEPGPLLLAREREDRAPDCLPLGRARRRAVLDDARDRPFDCLGRW